MRFVRYAAGRQMGVGYGFRRTSDEDRLPFAAPYNLETLHTVRAKYGRATEDAPVVELVFDAKSPDRWIVCQNRYANYRANPDGIRAPVAGYGYAQYFFPVFTADESKKVDRSWPLAAPLLIHRKFGWIGVETWQRISEESDSKFPSLEAEVSEAEAVESKEFGAPGNLNEAGFALLIWRNCWGRIVGRDFSQVNVLVTPNERMGKSPEGAEIAQESISNTLEEGLEFLAKRLNAMLPDVVKSGLSVAVGVPLRYAQTFDQSVVRIVYDDKYAREAGTCFDFRSGDLVSPVARYLSAEEQALAGRLLKSEWPSLYQKLLDSAVETRVALNYDILILAQSIDRGMAEGYADADAVEAQFQRIEQFRALLKGAGVAITVSDRVLRDAEAQLLRGMRETGWPDSEKRSFGLVERCVHAAPDDALWGEFVDALLKCRSPREGLRMLVGGLPRVPGYGESEQDYLRFFGAFQRSVEYICESGDIPDSAQMDAMYGVLATYNRNPVSGSNAIAYYGFLTDLSTLLTQVAQKEGAVSDSVLKYLSRFGFSSEQLSGIEDVAVRYVHTFHWTGCEQELKVLQALRKIDGEPTAAKLNDAVAARVAEQAQGSIDGETLMAFLNYIQAVQATNQQDNVCAMLSACTGPIEPGALRGVQSWGVPEQKLAAAGVAHVLGAQDISTDERIAWIEIEDRLEQSDGALAEFVAKDLRGSRDVGTQEQFDRQLRYVRHRLGDEVADDALIERYSALHDAESLAAKVLIRRIDAGREIACAPGSRLEELYLRCLWQRFAQELGACERWEAVNRLPERCAWAKPEAFVRVCAAERIDAQKYLKLEDWIRRLVAGEAREAPEGVYRTLEGAVRLRRQLDGSSNAYPALAGAMKRQLSRYTLQAMIPECYERAMGEADAAGCMQLFLCLSDYVKALCDGKSNESAENCLNAARWVNDLLSVSSEQIISTLHFPDNFAVVDKLAPYINRLFGFVVEMRRSVQRDDKGLGRALIYLSAMQLAKLSREDGSVDWNQYQLMMGVKRGDPSEINLIVYTERLLRGIQKYNPDLYRDYLKFVEQREAEGLKLPLPEKVKGKSTLIQWLTREKGRVE